MEKVVRKINFALILKYLDKIFNLITIIRFNNYVMSKMAQNYKVKLKNQMLQSLTIKVMVIVFLDQFL